MTTTDKKNEVNEFQCNSSHRACYVNILEAKAFKKNGVAKGDPKYGSSFMFAPDDADLKRLKAEVSAMLAAKHPGKKIVIRRLTQEEMDSGSAVEVQVPWKNGDKEADRMKTAGKDGEVFRGSVLVKASSKYQPNLAALVDKKLQEFTTPEGIAANAKFFYSGAWMVPCFGLHYYKGDEGKPDGVSLYLNAVLFHKNDTRLGGARKSAAETFKSFVGTISDEDTTAGASAEELADEDEEF